MAAGETFESRLLAQLADCVVVMMMAWKECLLVQGGEQHKKTVVIQELHCLLQLLFNLLASVLSGESCKVT